MANNSNPKKKKVSVLKERIRNISRLQKIMRQYPEGEERFSKISEFVKNLQDNEKSKDLITLCRMYSTYEMNEICFAQEILRSEREIEEKLRCMKEEVIEFSKILTELEKLTCTKKFDSEKRKKISDLIKKANFVEFKEEFQKILEITRMACTTEIDVEIANKLFALALTELTNLSRSLN